MRRMRVLFALFFAVVLLIALWPKASASGDLTRIPNTPPFQIEASVGGIRSGTRSLTYGALSGDMFWPAHTELWGQSNDGDAYFPPWPIPVGVFPSEASLGSAHVNWRFERATP